MLHVRHLVHSELNVYKKVILERPNCLLYRLLNDIVIELICNVPVICKSLTYDLLVTVTFCMS